MMYVVAFAIFSALVNSEQYDGLLNKEVTNLQKTDSMNLDSQTSVKAISSKPSKVPSKVPFKTTKYPSKVPSKIPSRAPSKKKTNYKPSKLPTDLPLSNFISCGQVATISANNLLNRYIGTGLNVCRINDATSCTTCSCNYYVQYSTDAGSTWLGLTFDGTPGGTGCPLNGLKGQATATADNAKQWLQTKYIAQGYCCPASPATLPTIAPQTPSTNTIACSNVASLGATSLLGHYIGTGQKICRIDDATTCGSCACNYYVKYSTDGGSTWLGLTFDGTPGGTGCPLIGGTADDAKQWLLTKYIAQGYCCA
mmetsp:Transcript_9527/g.14226  ORF Transcript_9527/g.14226 Transcript_9527/m.14226 type:complete len:310 (+) Transcript_9527:1933-2862(+)